MDRPKSLIITITTPDGKKIGESVATEKVFSTGSQGYNGFGKLVDPNNPTDRYQLSLNLVRIGSKPKAVKDAKKVA